MRPSISLVTDRSLQSFGYLNPSPKPEILVQQSLQGRPKRFSNQLDWVLQVQAKVWGSLSFNSFTYYKIILFCSCLELPTLVITEVSPVPGVLGTLNLLNSVNPPTLGTNLWV
jgi:hypothetical protein